MTSQLPMSDPGSSLPEYGDSDSNASAEQATAWLRSLGLAQYCDTFINNGIDMAVLPTLTSAELRDDLNVSNFHHRRIILRATSNLQTGKPAAPSVGPPADKMPEHGRILDHLSNVRTYHSWLRVGVQFLSFAIVTLRLAPDFRHARLVTAAAFYFGAVALFAMLYAVYRYRRVIRMIDRTLLSNPTYTPDALGTLSLLLLLLCAAVLAIVIIALPAPS